MEAIATERTAKVSYSLPAPNNIVPRASRPDFDRDVLVPLRAWQAAQAEKVAAAAAVASAQAAQAAIDAQTIQYSAPIQYTPPGDAKSFIYNAESGNVACKINGGAIDCNYNGNRACGIGQALPCQKLTAFCKLSDYACQDDWFTNSYMVPRYGTWENARAFWLANHWW